MADSDAIVIVSGIPRSGTSMVMRMLECGGMAVLTDQMRAADEDNPKGYYEFEPVKRTKDDASWLDQGGGHVVKIVYRLLHDLPTDRPYRVVMMRRRMQEVIASQTAMLERTGRQGAALPAEKLGQIFEQQMAATMKYLAEHDCFEVIELNYNDVMKDAAAQAAKLNQFLGGGLDEQAMVSVVEPGLYRQHK